VTSQLEGTEIALEKIIPSTPENPLQLNQLSIMVNGKYSIQRSN
jgi:hypothetical protein